MKIMKTDIKQQIVNKMKSIITILSVIILMTLSIVNAQSPVVAYNSLNIPDYAYRKDLSVDNRQSH
jgi:hypothetical protein